MDVELSELLEKWLPQVPLGRVVDIGAGEGDVAIWLARHMFKVDAIERDPARCARMKEACEGLEVSIYPVDVREFDFPEGAYSLIYAGGILHFIKPTDLWILADRMVSSLVPGGYLIAEVFTTDDPGYEELRNAGAEEIEPNTFLSSVLEDPIHYFTPGELGRTFSSLDIQVLEEARYLDPKDPVGYRSGASIVARRVGRD